MSKANARRLSNKSGRGRPGICRPRNLSGQPLGIYHWRDESVNHDKLGLVP